MDVLEAVLYIILTLILIALVGVLSWLIYDYYEYKKVVRSKISETVAQSDESNSLLKKDITEMNACYPLDIDSIHSFLQSKKSLTYAF
jgi:cell division protein FtsL